MGFRQNLGCLSSPLGIVGSAIASAVGNPTILGTLLKVGADAGLCATAKDIHGYGKSI